MSEKTCFVISPIDKPGSPIRKRADDILNYVIRKVAEPEYKVIRADEINESGLISPKIIKHLKEDDLVIAYLAENNPNVFFELAIRYVTQKPCIQLKEPSQELPFDIKDTQTIEVDLTEPKSVEEGKERIRAQMDTMSERTPNPIITALDTLTLQGSTKPYEKVVGEIMSAISELQANVTRIGKNPIDEEIEQFKLIANVEMNIAGKIGQPLSSLGSSLQVIKSNIDKLSVELQEEVKKIENAYLYLQGFSLSLKRPRTELGALMQKRNSQNRTS